MSPLSDCLEQPDPKPSAATCSVNDQIFDQQTRPTRNCQNLVFLCRQASRPLVLPVMCPELISVPDRRAAAWWSQLWDHSPPPLPFFPSQPDQRPCSTWWLIFRFRPCRKLLPSACLSPCCVIRLSVNSHDSFRCLLGLFQPFERDISKRCVKSVG